MFCLPQSNTVEHDSQDIFPNVDILPFCNPVDSPLGLSTKAFRLIWKKMHLPDIFKKYVTDHRRCAITYAQSALLSSGVLIYFLHSGSRNAFQEQAKSSPIFTRNIAKAIDAPKIPCSKTIEDAFSQIDPTDLVPVLPALFRQLINSKLFQLHPETTDNGRFLIAVDGFTNHTYTTDSQHDTSTCPYCLKRRRGKHTWFYHIDVCLSVVTPGGQRFPLFFHRVQGAPEQENYSNEKFKQECELTALEPLIKQFRSFFPKLKFTVLADSLYANKRIMELAEKYQFEYAVVRKSGSLSSLNSEVDGLKKYVTHVSTCCRKGGQRLTRTAFVINDLFHAGHAFRLIDFQEKARRLPLTSGRFSKKSPKSRHWQWICNGKVTNVNIFEKAEKARLRWLQEDQGNSLNNRGFAARHDMSRAPESQTVWRFGMYIAYFLIQLMTIIALLHPQKMAIRNRIKDLWAELAKVSPEFLWNLPLPAQLRFVFDSS